MTWAVSEYFYEETISNRKVQHAIFETLEEVQRISNYACAVSLDSYQ